MDWTGPLEEWWESTALNVADLTQQQRSDMEVALVAIADAAMFQAVGIWDDKRARKHAGAARATLMDIGLTKGWEAQTAASEFIHTAMTGVFRAAIGALFA